MHPILLIVDDEPRIFQALRRTLHREQLELMYAESGEDALEMLEKFPAAVVLADENMPGMTGTQLLTIVRQRWPDAVRMLLTGTARMEVVVKAVNQGQVSRFFTKPCDDAELIVAIRESLEERAAKLDGATPSATTRANTPPLTTTPSMTLGAEPTPDDHSTRPDETTTGEETARREDPTAAGEGLAEIQLDGEAGDEDVDELLADLRRSLDDLAS